MNTRHPVAVVLALAWWAAVIAAVVRHGPIVGALVATISLLLATLIATAGVGSSATRAPLEPTGPVATPDGSHPLTVGELADCLDGLPETVPVHLHITLDPETGLRLDQLHVVALGDASNPTALVLAGKAPWANV